MKFLHLFNKIISPFNLELKKKTVSLSSDLDKDFIRLYEKCKPYTMTSPERMYGLYKAVEYIVNNNIQGDFVECGVWRGGSSMMMALSLEHFNQMNRQLYLYDTFEGMAAPTEHDVSIDGNSADKDFKKFQKNTHNEWCYASLEEVKSNLLKTQYPSEKVTYVKGMVETTIPDVVPEKISLLRIDTDWYESTIHELNHLYPRLATNGVLIIDDYGYWKGAKEAVDTYFKKKSVFPFLIRLDNTGRILIKRD